MIRKQFFIEEDQQKRLKVLAARLGVKESELIREGVNKVLAEKEQQEDWKAGLLKVLEMEGDFEGLEATVAQNRRHWKARTDEIVKRGLVENVTSKNAS